MELISGLVGAARPIRERKVKLMKKLLCVLLVLCLTPVFALGETVEGTQPNVPALTQDDFTFTFESVPYLLGGEAAVSAIEAKYGAAMDKTEVDSCMFSGKDKEFSNNDLIVGTYPAGKDGQDMIETIMVLSETFETARGACVGMTLDEVADLYGDDFTLDYDQMTYTLPQNGAMLVFSIDLESDEVACWSLLKNTSK